MAPNVRHNHRYSKWLGKKACSPRNGSGLLKLHLQQTVQYKAKHTNVAPNVGARTISQKILMLKTVFTVVSGFRNGTGLFELYLKHSTILIVPYKATHTNMALKVGHNHQYLKMSGKEEACSSRNETRLFELYL